MPRRLSAFFFLLAIMANSMSMFLFAGLRLHMHHYRMGHVEASSLVVLKVNVEDHPKLLHGVRELQLNGRWFDVQHVQDRSGVLTVVGHFDDEEEGLLQRFSHFSNEIVKHGKDRWPVVSPPVYLEPLVSSEWKQPFLMDLPYAEPSDELAEPVLRPQVPPPAQAA